MSHVYPSVSKYLTQVYNTNGFAIQGVPKKPQTIENNLLLEFQWPSTKLKPRVRKLLT